MNFKKYSNAHKINDWYKAYIELDNDSIDENLLLI